MITTDNQYLLNHMNKRSADVGLGDELAKTKNVLKCRYDFATQGGAIGDISLLTDLKNPKSFAVIPAKAVITKVLVDVITPATSGGSATVAIKSEGAADLLGATAVASVTGMLDGVPANTAASAVKTTVARTIKATVAVAALTAGQFNVFVEYVISN